MTVIFHMDKEKNVWKVCLCTDDMKSVNLPFGKTQIGVIYKVEKQKGASFQEKRNFYVGTAGANGHDFINDVRIENIKDCDYIVCTKIGIKLKRMIEVHGISVIEYQGDVETVLERMRRYLLLTRSI